MQSTTTYESGNIVLVHFPFTDLSSTKKRPALVVSPKSFGERYNDVVIVALTGRNQKDDTLRLAGWKAAGLIKQTWLKPVVGTVSSSLVARKLGALSDEDFEKVQSVMNILIDTRFVSRKAGQ